MNILFASTKAPGGIDKHTLYTLYTDKMHTVCTQQTDQMQALLDASSAVHSKKDHKAFKAAVNDELTSDGVPR